MSPTAIATISGLVVATLISAFISALETALFCLKEHHVAKLNEDRPDLRRQLARISRHTRKSINEVLFLSSVANMAIAILGFYIIRQGPLIFPDQPILNAFAILGMIVFFGDLLPKLFALVLPELVFRITIRPYLFMSPLLEKIASPLAVLSDKIAGSILPSGIKPIGNFTDVEIETLVEIRKEEGALTPSESHIIQEVIRLGNKTTKDCLTPRTDTFMLEADISPTDAAEQIRAMETWEWWIPVYEENPDTIIGTLDVRKWLHEPTISIRSALQKPLFVPETMNALEAFRRHLNSPGDLAIVLDEYGGVEGVLGYSHLVEELLEGGAPAPQSNEKIVQPKSGNMTVSGDTRLDELSKAIGIELEHKGLDTIGGLVFTTLGYLPKPGAIARINGIRAVAKKIEGARITEIELRFGTDRLAALDQNGGPDAP
ncbi:MAG: hemolysin family protein [Verrucomicrobiales bacterium]